MPTTDGFDLFELQSSRSQQRRALMRVFCMVALAITAFSIPAVGANRYLVGVILLVAAPVPALLVRFLPRRFGLFGQSGFDVAMAGVLSWFIPQAWAAALVVVSTSPTASAAITGKRFYATISTAGLGMLALSAVVTDVEFWLAPWVVAVVLVPVILSYIDVYLSAELSAAAHLSDVVDSTSVIVWEIDARSGEVLSANGRIEDILGLSVDRAIEHRTTIPELVHRDDVAEVVKVGAAPPGTTARGQVRLRHSDGSFVWIRYNLKVHQLNGRKVLRGVAVDIGELIAAHEETRWRAERDQLTGLANRALMLEVLGQHLRRGDEVSFLMLDLDGFKEINDTLGHGAGDQYLQAVARRLQAVVVGDSLVARLGGDEFAVVTPRRNDAAQTDLLNDLLAACEMPVALEGVELAGAVSIGVAHAPEHGNDTATIMRRADVAMYAAKRSETSTHVFDVLRDEPSGERLKLSSEVERALTGQELRLWFQPKVMLSTGEILGAEGLLRWHHPTRGVMLPGDFIDMLELSRHNRPLAQSVIVQGVAFAAAHRRDGAPWRVSVNVSMRNLLEPDLAERIADTLDRFELPASSLVLEVTERDITDERALSRLDLRSLRELGVGLSIDDFGTGHSSLVRLQQMPVTELKIDQRFVSGLGTDPEAPILVRSIVELCRSLGLDCVAEGVERREQAEMLLDLGCQMAQGFYFSPAVAADSFDQLNFVSH